MSLWQQEASFDLIPPVEARLAAASLHRVWRGSPAGAKTQPH